MNRPAREGTKKQAVEKVLEAAAAKRAAESPEKVIYLLLSKNYPNYITVLLESKASV